MTVTHEWRGDFENAELNALHAEAFDHRVLEDDWKGQLRDQSLGWVCARERGELVCFVNVAWDGAIHALSSTRSWLRRRAGGGSGPNSSRSRRPRRRAPGVSRFTSTSRTT